MSYVKITLEIGRVKVSRIMTKTQYEDNLTEFGQLVALQEAFGQLVAKARKAQPKWHAGPPP